MALSKELVSQFVKATKDTEKSNTNSVLNGTTVIYNNKIYVKLDGSDRLTPITTTTELNENERVTVTIQDHQAVVNGNVTNPSASTGTTTAIIDTVTQMGEVVARKATVEDLNAERARIDNLVAEDVTIKNRLTVAEADILDLDADNAIIHGTLTAQRADIDSLDANKLDASIADITYATITNLNATNADLYNLESTYGQFQALVTSTMAAHDASITNLNTNKANISDLNAVEADIDDLKATKADISDLETNYAEIDLANVNNAWIQNGVIKNGAISDAQILGVSANKITAGTIDASNITVTNLNADNITTGTINGQRIGNASIDLSKLSETVITESDFESTIQYLEERIDGAIETFTIDHVPTLNNQPASSWTSYSDKNKHVGDIAYVVNASLDEDGYSYRFIEKSGQIFEWILIKDVDVTLILQEIAEIEGDVSNLQTFETTTSSWITSTEADLVSLKSRTTTVETTLGTKVDTSTFNSLSQTVSENSASITSLGTVVGTKADQSTVTTLTNTVNSVSQKANTNESNIATLNQTVTTKADQSTVTTLTNTVNTVSQTVNGLSTDISELEETVSTKADGSRVTTLESEYSELSQDLSGFKTTVSNTYSTKTETYNAIENIEIGGRNLINDYSDEHGGSEYIIGTYILSEELIVGEEYTITIDAESDSLTNSITLWLNDDILGPVVTFPVSSFTSRSIKNETFVVPLEYETGDDKQIISFCSYPESTISDSVTTIYRVKLEKGNKSTDWTPSPEDVDESIGERAYDATVEDFLSQYSEFTQTSEEFQSNVTNYMFDTNDRITYSESAITQLSDNISNLIVDENGTSLIIQTPEGFRWSTEKYALIDDISNQIDSVEDSINDVEETLDNRISEVENTTNIISSNINSYMEFSNDGLKIGKNESKMSVNVTNDRISFNDNGQEVAYINGQMLYIENEQVLKNLRFGDFVFFERQGSNYIINKNNMLDNATVKNRNSSSSEYMVGTYNLKSGVNIVSGEIYTFSFNVIINGNKKGWNLYFGGNEYDIGWQTNVNGYSSGTYYITFTANSNQESASSIYLYVSNNSGPQNATPVTGTCVLNSVCLTRGSRPQEAYSHNMGLKWVTQ